MKNERSDSSIVFNIFCVSLFLSQFASGLHLTGIDITITLSSISLIVLIIVDLFVNDFKITCFKRNSNIWRKMIFFWILWTIMSFIWSKDIISTGKVFSIFLVGFIYSYYFQKLVDSKDKMKKILTTLTYALFIHNILCFLELKYGLYFFSIYADKYLAKGYPVSTFTNTNNLGCYLTIMIFLSLYSYNIEKKDSKKKIFHIILVVSSLFILINTNSRAAIISIVISLFIYVIFMIKRLKVFLSISLISLVFVVTINLNYNYNMYFNSFVSDVFSINILSTGGSDFYRKNAYLNGLDFLKDTYGFGVSVGNVEFWMENYGLRFTNNIKPLHNWWLEILVSSGIVVTFFMLLTWCTYYVNIFTSYINSNSNYKKKLLKVNIMIIGIAFTVASIAPSSLYKMEWPWVLLGVFFMLDDWTNRFMVDNDE